MVSRPIPNWLAFTILGLAVAGAGWFAWWQWMGDSGVGEAIILDDPAVVATSRPVVKPGRIYKLAANPTKLAAITDGVNAAGPKSWRVRAGAVVLLISERENKKFSYSYTYWKTDLFPLEQRQLLVSAAAVLRNPKTAEQVKVTEAQVTQLRKLSLRPSVKINPVDEQRVEAAWGAYVAAGTEARTEPEKKLMALVEEIGNRNLQASIAELGRRVELVKQVLTAEQIAAIEKIVE